MNILNKIEKKYFIKAENLFFCFLKICYIILLNIIIFALPFCVVLMLILKEWFKKIYLVSFIVLIFFLITFEEFLHIIFFRVLHKIYSFDIKITTFLKIFLKRIEVIPKDFNSQFINPIVFIMPHLIIFSISLFLFLLSILLKFKKIFLFFSALGMLYSFFSVIPIGPFTPNDGYNAIQFFLKREKKR